MYEAYEAPAGAAAEDHYRRAVEVAGVVELPDDGEPTTRLPDLLSGRFEDDEPPGAPR